MKKLLILLALAGGLQAANYTPLSKEIADVTYLSTNLAPLDDRYSTIIATNTAASSNNAGRLRYYTVSTNSYVDVCMKTNASGYGWINIQSFGW